MELDLYQHAAVARTPAANNPGSSKSTTYIPSAANVSEGVGGGQAGVGVWKIFVNAAVAERLRPAGGRALHEAASAAQARSCKSCTGT